MGPVARLLRLRGPTATKLTPPRGLLSLLVPGLGPELSRLGQCSGMTPDADYVRMRSRSFTRQRR